MGPSVKVQLTAHGWHSRHPQVDDARKVEEVILGLMSQRWSHLRRQFSARTRFRPSQTSTAAFELEIVERRLGHAWTLI